MPGMRQSFCPAVPPPFCPITGRALWTGERGKGRKNSARGERLRSGKEEMTIWLGVEQCIHGVSLRKLLTLARHPIDMNELFARMREEHRETALPPSSEEALSFTLLWCLKHDLLEKM